MLIIDDEYKTLAFNRGDEINFVLEVKNEDGTDYVLTGSDFVRLNVVPKRGYSSGVIISKKFMGVAGESSFQITLTSEETKDLCDPINKPLTLWYELDFNDDTTLIGFDSSLSEELQGAKRMIVLPEGIKPRGRIKDA